MTRFNTKLNVKTKPSSVTIPINCATNWPASP